MSIECLLAGKYLVDIKSHRILCILGNFEFQTTHLVASEFYVLRQLSQDGPKVSILDYDVSF